MRAPRCGATSRCRSRRACGAQAAGAGRPGPAAAGAGPAPGRAAGQRDRLAAAGLPRGARRAGRRAPAPPAGPDASAPRVRALQLPQKPGPRAWHVSARRRHGHPCLLPLWSASRLLLSRCGPRAAAPAGPRGGGPASPQLGPSSARGELACCPPLERPGARGAAEPWPCARRPRRRRASQTPFLNPDGPRRRRAPARERGRPAPVRALPRAAGRGQRAGGGGRGLRAPHAALLRRAALQGARPVTAAGRPLVARGAESSVVAESGCPQRPVLLRVELLVAMSALVAGAGGTQ